MTTTTTTLSGKFLVGAKAEPRNEIIFNLRDAGYNLQEIGDAVGVTRERVRQILAAAGLKTISQSERIAAAAAAWRASGTIRDAEDVAREYRLGTSDATIAALRAACPELLLPVVHNKGGKWDFHAIVNVVRRITIEQKLNPATGWLTSETYEDVRSPGDPTRALIVSRHYWNDVMRAVGFDPLNAAKLSGSRGVSIPDSVLDAAILEFIASKPRRISVRELEQFTAARSDLPSVATIRNRFRRRGIKTFNGIFSDVQGRHTV